MTRPGDEDAGRARDASLTVEDVARLDDAALEAEVTRRRRRRLARPEMAGAGASAPEAAGSTPSGGHAGDRRRGVPGLAQAYANLELAPGASLEAVRRRYLELLARYDPTRFDGDRRRLAEGLVDKLRDAYETVRGALGPADARGADGSTPDGPTSDDVSPETPDGAPPRDGQR